MIRSTGKSDKQIRKRKYLLTFFIFPIALTLTLCGIIYLASTHSYISEIDKVFGYIVSFIIGFLSFITSIANWLKMPDGAYYHTKDITHFNSQNVNNNEPNKYEVEYFYSKTAKVVSISYGLVMIGAGCYIIFKSYVSVLIPLVNFFIGMTLLYKGVTGLFDNTPKLKLDKKGLWTNKLGFVDWNNVMRTEIIAEKTGRAPRTTLAIYLRDTAFAKANQPDEILNLTDIDNKQSVERTLNNLKSECNILTI